MEWPTRTDIKKIHPHLTTYSIDEVFINRVLGHPEAELSLWGDSDMPLRTMLQEFLDATYGKLITPEQNIGFRLSGAERSRVIGIVHPLFLEPTHDTDAAVLLRKIRSSMPTLQGFQVGYAFLSSFELPGALNSKYEACLFGNLRNRLPPGPEGFMRYPIEPKTADSEPAR